MALEVSGYRSTRVASTHQRLPILGDSPSSPSSAEGASQAIHPRDEWRSHLLRDRPGSWRYQWGHGFLGREQLATTRNAASPVGRGDFVAIRLTTTKQLESDLVMEALSVVQSTF